MVWGAWGPLPLRLGPDPEQGWDATEQSRFAADLAAIKRTAPLACVTMTFDGAVFSVTDYAGQNGTGPGNAPSVIAGGDLKWDPAYPDWAGTLYPWRIRSVRVTVLGSAPAVCTVELYPNSSKDLAFHLTDLSGGGLVGLVGFEVKIYGDWLPERQIGDYDGATDKENSQTEGNSSYFYDWFLEMQAMRGSAYSKGTGYVDAENFAIARQFGAISRNCEKLEANSLPGTSDEKLETWLDVLGIPLRSASERWRARQQAEAKLRAAASRNNPANIDDAVRDLLGEAFVAAHRSWDNALSSPPAITFWPSVNPGPPTYDIGGGCWASERAHYWVEVTQPTHMSDVDFKRLINVDLFALLDLRLPATYSFGVATTDGFLLDISQLDFTGL